MAKVGIELLLLLAQMTPYFSTKNFYLYWTGLCFLLLSSCAQHYTVSRTEQLFYKPAPGVSFATDSVAEQMARPYRDSLNTTMNRVLGRSAQPLEKGQPESALGNFVSDLCFQIASDHLIKTNSGRIDFCVLNNGGLRSSLPEGEIRLRNVFELMPFENELVILELDGNSISSLFEYIAQKGGVPVSGLTMSITDGKPMNVKISGQPFDPSKSYFVLTSDYLASGGDSMGMFAGAISKKSTGIKVRDAIVTWIELKDSANELIISQKDGRIIR